MIWREYKEQYGRCEVESAPFECKICGRVVKYDRNTVHTHLKNVHGINWAMYLDRIRRMRRGEIPEDLPAPETHECRVCNVRYVYFIYVWAKALQLCMELRVFLSEGPFLRESVVIYSYILVHQI